LGGWWGLKQNSIMSTGKVVLRTLAGLVIGAIAGILFAPEKGSTTRKQIIGDAENLAKKGKAKYDDVKKDVKNAAANFKHDVVADINHATS